MNVIDIKLTSYWPYYPRLYVRMNEAFRIPTQLSTNSLCFETCNFTTQRNTCVTPLFLVCYRSCKNAVSNLLRIKSHLALSLALHTNPPACAIWGCQDIPYQSTLLIYYSHSAAWFSESTEWSQMILRSCLKSGWFSVKLRNCERNVGRFGMLLLLAFRLWCKFQEPSGHCPSWKLKRAP